MGQTKGRYDRNRYISFREKKLCTKCGKKPPRGVGLTRCYGCDDKHKEKMKLRGLFLRKTVLEHYGAFCKCCGESCEKFLTLDHVNNDGYIERKIRKWTSAPACYRYVISENFPDRYQILCYNCNLGKSKNNGVCPHREALVGINN